MGICELLYFREIPPKVSMNESIELAKLFSTARSGQFVNGILDAVLADMKSAGELTKAGRGLYEGENRGPASARKKPIGG
jgi:N utilization substance protein B